MYSFRILAAASRFPSSPHAILCRRLSPVRDGDFQEPANNVLVLPAHRGQAVIHGVGTDIIVLILGEPEFQVDGGSDSAPPRPRSNGAHADGDLPSNFPILVIRAGREGGDEGVVHK